MKHLGIILFLSIFLISILSISLAVACEDSDSGLDPNHKGTISYTWEKGPGSNTDNCMNGESVIEYDCNINPNKWQEIECNDTCLEGECVDGNQFIKKNIEEAFKVESDKGYWIDKGNAFNLIIWKERVIEVDGEKICEFSYALNGKYGEDNLLVLEKIPHRLDDRKFLLVTNISQNYCSVIVYEKPGCIENEIIDKEKNKAVGVIYEIRKYVKGSLDTLNITLGDKCFSEETLSKTLRSGLKSIYYGEGSESKNNTYLVELKCEDGNAKIDEVVACACNQGACIPTYCYYNDKYYQLSYQNYSNADYYNPGPHIISINKTSDNSFEISVDDERTLLTIGEEKPINEYNVYSNDLDGVCFAPKNRNLNQNNELDCVGDDSGLTDCENQNQKIPCPNIYHPDPAWCNNANPKPFYDENNCTTGFKCIYNLSNGMEVEINITEQDALEIAKKELGELNFSVELKEKWDSTKTNAVYELNTEKEARLFGLINKKAKITAEINSESGEINLIKKPWWSFLASGI